MSVDLHCHTAASFDSTADVLDMLARAAASGLTHLAITDHGTIDGALRARDATLPGIQVIVGEEIRTTAGDLIALFIERPIPEGLDILETCAAVRAQHGIVGMPHPFDVYRPSVGVRLTAEESDRLAEHVDYVEVVNGRLATDAARLQALAYAARHGLPGVDASDAHTVLEMGRIQTPLVGRADSADALRDSLRQRIAATMEAHEIAGGARDRGRLRRVIRHLGR